MTLPSGSPPVGVRRCPFSLRVDEIAGMLNCELAGHPVYDGIELQRFDDAVHGSGLLVFLGRRDSGRIDFYVERGLRVDRDSYAIGGGIGSWNETVFDADRLVFADDGVSAEVRFIDVDGRTVEVSVDDRDGRRRRRGGLLAPVGATTVHPRSLLLVWMPAFDLVRRRGAAPVVRIDGEQVDIGALPGGWLHRRHLVKVAAPVVTVELNRTEGDVPADLTSHAGQEVRFDAAGRLADVAAIHAGHTARLVCEPGLPDLAALPEGGHVQGRWHVAVDAARLTGGVWSARRAGAQVTLALDVDERWRPGRLPWLMRLVTTVVPVFRRWPTTYRWRADLRLGAQPTMAARWERTGDGGGQGYRRATGS